MKKIYLSKTIIANVLTIAALVLDKVTGLDLIPVKYGTAGLAIVNIVLRTLTNQPLQMPVALFQSFQSTDPGGSDKSMIRNSH